MQSEAHIIIIIHIIKVVRYLGNNSCQRIIPFPVQRRYLRKAAILHEIHKLFLVEMTPCEPQEVVYSVKSSSNHPYISKKGYETLEQQCMPLLVAYPHISHADRVPAKCDILHKA